MTSARASLAPSLVGYDDLADRLGSDRARLLLARTRGRSHRVDPEPAARATERNPVHLVLLAHARAAAVLRQANALGVAPASDGAAAPEVSGSTVASEVAATVELLEKPVADPVRAAYLLVRRLERLAAAVLLVLDTGAVLPRGELPPTAAHRARLHLIATARAVLAAGLGTLGVGAPDRM